MTAHPALFVEGPQCPHKTCGLRIDMTQTPTRCGFALHYRCPAGHVSYPPTPIRKAA